MTEPLRPALGLRTVVAPTIPSGVVLVRQARKDGRLLAILRLLRHEQHCTVETQVFPRGNAEAELRPGPYSFKTRAEASAFVEEAVDALTYLGCQVD